MKSGDQSQQFDQRHMADEHAHGQLNRAPEPYETVDPQGTVLFSTLILSSATETQKPRPTRFP